MRCMVMVIALGKVLLLLMLMLVDAFGHCLCVRCSSSSSSITSAAADGSTSIWINRQRFGDVGGQRLGGFVGGLWTRAGAEAGAWGWAGGWRRWRCSPGSGAGVQHEAWTEVGAIGGHNAPVRGLAWSPGGEYLLSAR